MLNPQSHLYNSPKRDGCSRASLTCLKPGISLCCTSMPDKTLTSSVPKPMPPKNYGSIKAMLQSIAHRYNQSHITDLSKLWPQLLPWYDVQHCKLVLVSQRPDQGGAVAVREQRADGRPDRVLALDGRAGPGHRHQRCFQVVLGSDL